MPNSKDLNALELRQTTSGGRRIIAFSPTNTLSCLVHDDNTLRPFRVGQNQLPVVVDLQTTSVVRVECSDESTLDRFIFYIPYLEYLRPLKR